MAAYHRPAPSLTPKGRRIAAVAAALLAGTAASRAAPLELEGAISIPGVRGGFDLMAIDVPGHRFFLNAEDNGSHEIIDLKSGQRIESISGMDEPKGVVYRPELHRIYVANGDGKVRLLDSVSYAPLGVLKFREKANNLRFDVATGELFVGVGNSFGAIAVVDAKLGRITAEIPLAGYPKQFEVEGDRIYVNVPTANHVAVLSRLQRKVVATWPVPAAKENVPMGFDRASHRLLVGCEPGELAILDTADGRQVASVEIDGDSDGVHYDAKRRLIYVSCGSGAIDIVRQLDPDHYERSGRLTVPKGAGTSLFVPELDRLYLPVPAHEGRPAELRIYRTAGAASS